MIYFKDTVVECVVVSNCLRLVQNPHRMVVKGESLYSPNWSGKCSPNCHMVQM